MDTVDVLITPAETGGYVDDDGVWVPGDPGSPFVVHGCQIAPRTAEERVDVTVPAILDGETLYIPDPTVAITAASELQVGVTYDPEDGWVGGVRYSVEGDPGVWGDAGVEVAVRRWATVAT